MVHAFSTSIISQIHLFKTILIVFAVLTDIYAFIGILSLLKGKRASLRFIITTIYWSVTILFLIFFVFFFRIDSGQRDPAGLSVIFLFIGLYYLIYLPKITFIGFRFVEDIIWIFSWFVKLIKKVFNGISSNPIRVGFISKAGLVVGIISFVAILWGFVFGRFQYQIENVSIKFDCLPAHLNGLRIVQLSDIHLGSMYGKRKQVQKAVDMVNSMNPDLVLFTGDLVNHFTEEAYGWEDLFAQISSRYGKYSVLGNHDYGEYWEWKSENEMHNNMLMLLKVHNDMGFHLLRNEWDTIHVNGATIAIVGVETWGQIPFKQYGDLNKALKNLPEGVFKILLSHDPTHWDAQVTGKTDIPLTLSGHTHAAQFGIKLGKYRWSPSKYIFKRWNGLYREKEQVLYVNRGLGFIGFPGRIGLRPEITLITLTKDSN
jgi:predicted MPP superfamily phosphohydrolase